MRNPKNEQIDLLMTNFVEKNHKDFSPKIAQNGYPFHFFLRNWPDINIVDLLK